MKEVGDSHWNNPNHATNESGFSEKPAGYYFDGKFYDIGKSASFWSSTASGDGDPVGHRHIWWNFVSSSRERIEQAKTDWREMRFDAVPGETEFIPLPGR